ncbi:hypothetical protein D3C84_678270 [compost metagenome]
MEVLEVQVQFVAQQLRARIDMSVDMPAFLPEAHQVGHQLNPRLSLKVKRLFDTLHVFLLNLGRIHPLSLFFTLDQKIDSHLVDFLQDLVDPLA